MTSSDHRHGLDSDAGRNGGVGSARGEHQARRLDYRQRGQAGLSDFSRAGGERWTPSQLQLISGFALTSARISTRLRRRDPVGAVGDARFR